jgi:hypothetical protein
MGEQQKPCVLAPLADEGDADWLAGRAKSCPASAPMGQIGVIEERRISG